MGAGAKGKYSDKVVDAICKAHEMGAGPIASAKAGGITATTYFEWVHSRPEFSERVKKARELGEEMVRERNLAIIQNAANGMRDEAGEEKRAPVWTAAAWILERKFPREFGRYEAIKHTGDMSVKVKVVPAKFSDESEDDDGGADEGAS